jgi:exo-1,4-beta-D-glucosaminidase
MVGFSCQWEWPDYLGLDMTVAEEDDNLPINEGVDLYAVKYTPEEEELLSDYFRDQVLWLRNHPGIFTWAVGSDAMPKPSLEKKYLNTLEKYDPTRSCLISAGEFTSELTGPSGMKMNGPYEYVPPVYWYEDKKLGGAFGFNSETGPGPQIPPLESLKKMMPEKDLWPPANDMWNFHSGRKEFNSVGVYLEALNKRYGKPENIEELALKAQLMNYEAIRPMFEAFVINRPVATGVVQWMLNSPRPELYWQLYDYYLMPTGAYYGTMKACQPLNVMYNYYDKKVYVSNDSQLNLEKHQVEVALYDINSKKVFEFNKSVDLKENKVTPLVRIPEHKGKPSVYFLDLKFKDPEGGIVSENFYWIASKGDKMNWEKYFWFYTPIKQFADYTAINALPEATLEASKEIRRQGDEWEIAVNLKNPGDKIAFFNELNVSGKQSGQSVLPVFWSDNYVSLLPGEQKTMVVKFYGKDLGSDTPVIRISGVNLKEKIVL